MVLRESWPWPKQLHLRSVLESSILPLPSFLISSPGGWEKTLVKKVLKIICPEHEAARHSSQLTILFLCFHPYILFLTSFYSIFFLFSPKGQGEERGEKREKWREGGLCVVISSSPLGSGLLGTLPSSSEFPQGHRD